MNIEKEFLDLKKVVAEAGVLASDYFYSDVNPATQKDDGSLVTEIDEKIEQILRTHIQVRFPDDTIVGEEGNTRFGTSGFVWIIDPIDGTDNFVRKIPFFAVTVTRLGPTAEDSFAIVYNPVSRQMFASFMENGSYENEHVCNLTKDPIGSKYFITVSGASAHADWVKPACLAIQKNLVAKFGKTGHYRSSLLEFSYVAASRIDGFMDIEMPAWDTAAGLYLVKAAGGLISILDDNGMWVEYDGAIRDLYGENFDQRVTVFVSHPDIHAAVLDFVGDPKRWAGSE